MDKMFKANKNDNQQSYMFRVQRVQLPAKVSIRKMPFWNQLVTYQISME